MMEGLTKFALGHETHGRLDRYFLPLRSAEVLAHQLKHFLNL